MTATWDLSPSARSARAPASRSPNSGSAPRPLGETFDVIEEDEARALLAAAWDGGVRYFDTSPWYGKGQAEHRLGRALYRRPREEYVISSKIGRVLQRPSKPGPFQRDDDWIGGLEFAHDMDYSYDGVMRSFEDSLQRLGINRIDVLLIHDLDTWHFKSRGQGRALLESARHERLARAGELARPGRHQGHRRRLQHDGDDPEISRFLRHGFLPDRDALHAARAGRARRGVPAPAPNAASES